MPHHLLTQPDTSDNGAVEVIPTENDSLIETKEAAPSSPAKAGIFGSESKSQAKQPNYGTTQAKDVDGLVDVNLTPTLVSTGCCRIS